MKRPSVSIIILSWNTKPLLRQCLKSLISELKSQNSNLRTQISELIVVDNGSTDGSQEYLRTQISELKTQNLKLAGIFNKRNLGFAKGNNQGIRVASSDLIMLLNSDTIVRKGAIEKLALQLIKHPEVGAVSPLLLLPDGQPQIDYYMRFPNLWQIGLYHHPLWRPLIMRTPFRWLIVNRINSQAPFEVDQLPGAALMAKKEVWQKVGFLDEDYQFLFEDVDWCYRARQKGFQLMVVPQAKVEHLGGASWKKKLEKDSQYFYRQFFSSLLYFVRKNYGLFEFQVFRGAIIINFLATLKYKLAFSFLKDAKQQPLWS